MVFNYSKQQDKQLNLFWQGPPCKGEERKPENEESSKGNNHDELKISRGCNRERKLMAWTFRNIWRARSVQIRFKHNINSQKRPKRGPPVLTCLSAPCWGLWGEVRCGLRSPVLSNLLSWKDNKPYSYHCSPSICLLVLVIRAQECLTAGRIKAAARLCDVYK